MFDRSEQRKRGNSLLGLYTSSMQYLPTYLQIPGVTCLLSHAVNWNLVFLVQSHPGHREMVVTKTHTVYPCSQQQQITAYQKDNSVYCVLQTLSSDGEHLPLYAGPVISVYNYANVIACDHLLLQYLVSSPNINLTNLKWGTLLSNATCLRSRQLKYWKVHWDLLHFKLT